MLVVAKSPQHKERERMSKHTKTLMAVAIVNAILLTSTFQWQPKGRSKLQLRATMAQSM